MGCQYDRYVSIPDVWPPEFTLDQERILRLLTGDRFYSNASAALREAILNSLDAIHRRRSEDASYEGSIKVEFDRSGLTLAVIDEGDGMNRGQVASLFTRIGASAADFDSRGVGTVGEFGIGVVSYFMAADTFSIETCDGEDDAVGLRFRKEMFAGGQAEEFVPERTGRGTTLRLALRDAATYEVLLDSFSHWCRGIQHLEAVEFPDGRPLSQGDVDSATHIPVQVPVPDGIELAVLSPISTEAAWEAMSGSSDVTILYRGVFVQDYVAEGLWGMRGAIHVDPKHFKPRLNREGFVGGEFRSEIDAFLRLAHPAVLDALAETLARAVAVGALDSWTARRWATLWLSVPRDVPYVEAASRWDQVFRSIPAFELAEGSRWVSATVDELIDIHGPIYVAPHPDEKQDDVIKSATRLLRETGKPVLRGLARDRSWLKGAGNYFATTADLISARFESELPAFEPIAGNAEAILEGLKARHVLYGGQHRVELVSLGGDAPPVLRVGTRLLVNTDIDAGKAFVLRSVELNRGRRGLIEVAAEIAPQYLTQVAAVVNAEREAETEILGLVKRRYVRSLVQ